MTRFFSDFRLLGTGVVYVQERPTQLSCAATSKSDYALLCE